MKVPYEKSFSEFLSFLLKAYPDAKYPEKFIPIIAHKATAFYVLQKYFPELTGEFLKLDGKFAYAISEPNWQGSPLNIRSTIKECPDGSHELYLKKSFVLDSTIGIFVVKQLFPEDKSVEEAKSFALVLVDTDYYRSTRVALEKPEATYLVEENTFITHYQMETTVQLKNALIQKISKREILLLARSIVFREQVAYAILAYLEASKFTDMASVASRAKLLIQRTREEPGNEEIAIAREILSASIVRILDNANAHPFWKWLSRFVKPSAT
ncbi:MAG: hypothetical protein LDLANPLL_00741 [Turneriella sp.]|nr:hypothetical protein [Turneriella sp.]